MKMRKLPAFALSFWLTQVLQGAGLSMNMSFLALEATKCGEPILDGVCTCEHYAKSGFFSGDYICDGCKDNKTWAVGCDLPCPMDTCPYGCDFIGRCVNPTIQNCKHSSRMGDAAGPSWKVTNSRGECQACKKGWYGKYCESNCGPESGYHCAFSAEGYCSRGGACYSCEEGYYGANCTLPCPKACPVCVMKDNMVALDHNKTEFMAAGECPGSCDAEHDTWGPTCENPCPPNCKKYEEQASCEKTDGHCRKCQDGWFGIECRQKCPDGCGGRCDMKTGKCDTCKKGRWGLPGFCNYTCGENCHSEECFTMNGNCKETVEVIGSIGLTSDVIGSCKPGFWLDDCTKKCPENTADRCNQKTGLPVQCSGDMYPSFAGDDETLGIYKCVYKGFIQVTTGYDWESNDTALLGTMTEGAAIDVTETVNFNGVTRLKFTKLVSLTGAGSSVDKSQDFRSLGPLVSAERAGWVTLGMANGMPIMRMEPVAQCEPCPMDCWEGKCDTKGHCTLGCNPGFHGPTCELPCSTHCVREQGCDKKHAGSVEEGWCFECQDGWMGPKCVDKCDPTCVTCEQGIGANMDGPIPYLWPKPENKKHCKTCSSDYPFQLTQLGPNFNEGSCDCIPASSFNDATGKCECDQPFDPKKEAHFENFPTKRCRHICKKPKRCTDRDPPDCKSTPGYVEVFRTHFSDCIEKRKELIVQRAVWSGEACDPQGCKSDECKYSCETDDEACVEQKEKEQKYFCLHKEYVDYIRGH